MSFKHWWLGSIVMNGVLGATSVYAECEPLPLPEDVLGYSVCKEWPAYEGQTITALSQIEPDPTLSDLPDGTGDYDLNLAVISEADGKPLARYSSASEFSSDALRFAGLSIDTARYKLASNLRAFGVRADFVGASRANPFNESLLTLFVREGNTLRPVLEQFQIASGSGEWDTNCAGEFSITLRTLKIADTSSHGFFDLIVRSETIDSVATEKNGECESKDKVPKLLVTTLHYDGRQYVLPKEMQRP